MRCSFSNGSGPGKTTHPFAPHEAALHTLFRSSPPCSFDAPQVRALRQTALDSASGICRRIGFEPHREQATLAVHLWQGQLRENVERTYDSRRLLFPFAYRALTFVVYRQARESGLGRDTRVKSAPQIARPASHAHDPVYHAQLNELPDLVAELPDSLRIAVNMRYFQDRSTAEIAEILHITDDAVRSRRRLLCRRHVVPRDLSGMHKALLVMVLPTLKKKRTLARTLPMEKHGKHG